MKKKKIIAVMGATGAQGGGLVRAITDDPEHEFTARAITRNVNSEKAVELKELGVEVVEANLDDPDSIKHAFSGAYGAFCVTFFWDHLSPEKELQHAKTMAEAAKDVKIKHVIWSTLEDTRKWVPLSDNRMPTLMDKYKVPHFDAKGEANAFFTERNLPVTFLYTSFYWDNFIQFGMGPQKGKDGTYTITLPMDDKKLPGIAAEDIGKCAFGIFKRGGELIGKSVAVAGESLTGTQMASTLSEALGTEVRYNSIEPEAYRHLGFPGADDLGNMFQFKRDFEKQYSGARDVTVARELNPQLHTFKEWLEENKNSIPLN